MAADPIPPFRGFRRETVAFLGGLKKHNQRDWFENHRRDYEEHVMAPARAFVVALGERLNAITPGVQADPRVNGSLFRIHRDIRFSADKTPYKTHVGILFWHGRDRMAGGGYYVHIEPPALGLGAGVYVFPPPRLKEFRQAAVHPEHGYDLYDIRTALLGRPGFELGGRHYKRVPAGFDAGHPNADLLLHNGLYAWHEAPIPGEFFSGQLVEYCMDRFRHTAPLFHWLVELLAGRFRD